MTTAKFKEYTILLNVLEIGEGDRLVAASLAEIPGCIAEGHSEIEARQRLEDLFPAYCAALEAIGAPVPPPNAPAVSVQAASFRRPSVMPFELPAAAAC